MRLWLNLGSTESLWPMAVDKVVGVDAMAMRVAQHDWLRVEHMKPRWVNSSLHWLETEAAEAAGSWHDDGVMKVVVVVAAVDS